MVSNPQQDLVDDLLVDYLAALDQYQAAQARVAESLKRGYLDLARSKQALGPLRMSQNSYDLGETLSRVQVTIARSSSSTENSGDDDVEEELDWSLGASPSSLAPPPTSSSAEPSSSSTLRQRTTVATSLSTPSDTPPTPPLTGDSLSSERTPRPLSRSQLLQFSAFPPPALRSAEAEFVKVAREVVGLVQAQRRVERLERG
ncbi:hypothetical protein BCR35DRAFT_298216 [Leucosporidium creatinivorum]|uniref:Vacuolar ATPase assembly protein VMA22 n=1 Tax=Leucosporidium creatinivorum TaxID=106004 RepID=A0A1Y2G466_9BASI|nr:hypothetical protein BCR35DRAFT_298216 [Leucosporidium creatinivorum]